MKRKPLSSADARARANLKRIWDERKDELDLTQEKAAEQLGFGTQGAVSHYLRGYTPLNTDATLKFSALLRVPPTDIRPDLLELLGAALRNVEPAPDGGRASIPLLEWHEVPDWLKSLSPDDANPFTIKRTITTAAKVSKNAYALVVRGDMMENPAGFPTFPAGAILIVDPDLPAEDGSFVTVRLRGEAEVTFLQVVRHGRIRYLKALNPRYPLIELDRGAEICGVVTRVEMDLL